MTIINGSYGIFVVYLASWLGDATPYNRSLYEKINTLSQLAGHCNQLYSHTHTRAHIHSHTYIYTVYTLYSVFYINLFMCMILCGCAAISYYEIILTKDVMKGKLGKITNNLIIFIKYRMK